MEKLLELDKDYCMALPVETEKLDSVEVYIKNQKDVADTLHCVLYSGKSVDTYCPAKQEKDLFFDIPANFEGYLKLQLDFDALTDEKCYIEFHHAKGLFLGASSEHLTGVVCFHINPPAKVDDFRNSPKIKVRRITDGICFRNVLPLQSPYKAENLLDGYSRPFGLPRMWMSEMKNEAYINLAFVKPSRVSEIQLILNSELEADVPKMKPKRLVTEYEIIVTGSDGKTIKTEVADNIYRFRRHKIDCESVENIRINVKENNGAPNMELFAIRLIK